MEPVRPRFVPDPTLSRDEMAALQREIADAAVLGNDLRFDPAAVGLDGPVDADHAGDSPTRKPAPDGSGAPLVAGVDQAFLDDDAVSAVVVLQGDRVVERATAVVPTEVPYVPGLLSFREGGAIVEAMRGLTVEPDLVLFDGSGRIHYREAGLATHLGVVFDVPSVGVAKRLLCGRPRGPTEDLPAGARVAIEADGRVEAAEGTVLGYALQTRQFDSGRVNPVYVSAGHRVSGATATDLVLALCADVKLPEPVRLADRFVGAVRDERAAEG